MEATEAKQESGTLRMRADALLQSSLPQRRYLNVQEAAEYLRSTVGSLYNKVHRRQITFVKDGRRVLFDIHDLHAYMERNKVYPRGEPSPVEARDEPHFKVIPGGIFGS